MRLLVGVVFVSEGIQQCLFPAELGVGRFTTIGLPSPEILAPFVGVVAMVGGLLLGLCTRLAAVALISDMLVASATTKMPILLTDGVWTMAHEARTDWSMLLGTLFLLCVGAGAWSLDAVVSRAAPGGSVWERRDG
jgi:uncharacterized membrane protein YphA (DoxX/SURF4 family)